jgi:hypothetical protein
VEKSGHIESVRRQSPPTVGIAGAASFDATIRYKAGRSTERGIKGTFTVDYHSV